jgi:hypothetical protein
MVKIGWGVTIAGNIMLGLALFAGVTWFLLPGVIVGCGGVFLLYILSFRM